MRQEKLSGLTEIIFNFIWAPEEVNHGWWNGKSRNDKVKVDVQLTRFPRESEGVGVGVEAIADEELDLVPGVPQDVDCLLVRGAQQTLPVHLDYPLTHLDKLLG